MVLAGVMAAGLLLAAPPGVQADVNGMRQALGSARLALDADGTVQSAHGFRWDSSTHEPTWAARAFVSRFAGALGVTPANWVAQDPVVAGSRSVVRFYVQQDGLPVLGAGAAVVVHGTVVEAFQRFVALTSTPQPFGLTPLEVVDAALAFRPALMPNALTADMLAARAQSAFWALAGNVAVPVHIFTLHSLDPLQGRRVVVNARSGAVMQVYPLVLTETAPASVFEPNPGADGMGQTQAVTLTGLDNSGRLSGDLFETANCCKRVTCLEQGDGGCITQGCVSALDTGTGEEARVAFSIPTALLPIPAQIAALCSLPDPIFVDAVSCAQLPRAFAVDGGYPYQPLDRASPAADATRSEEDEFAEVMAYYHMQKFHEHVRSFTANATFCLDSQQCDSSGVAALPLPVEVNLMTPQLDQTTLQTVLCQMCPLLGSGCGGRGATAGMPVTMDGYMRVDNAFFQPATDPSNNPFPIEVPGLITDYERIAFFQGTQRDFAYDGDVIYHEFTHGIINTVVTNGGMPAGLAGFMRDRWGVRDEAGGLNEGLADYFSQSYTDDAVTGEYAAGSLVMGELGIRNAGELWTCPAHTTGEVHDDSRPWSSALWQARLDVVGTDQAKARRMDRAVFTAMATLPPNASLAQATVAVAAALKTEFPGNDEVIDAAFSTRGVTDCFRARHVIEVNGETVTSNPVEYLQFAGKAEVGLSNHAPGHMQLQLDLPVRTRAFTLSFNAQGGGILGGIFGGGGDNSIEVVVKADEPIMNTYTTTVASHDGITETVTPNQNGDATVTIQVATSGGLEALKKYYVGFNVLADTGVTVRSINVSLDRADPPDAGMPEDAGTASGSSSSGGGASSDDGSGGDAPASGPCNCQGTLPASTPWLGLGLVAAALLIRRRR